jgi:hypothetical protein
MRSVWILLLCFCELPAGAQSMDLQQMERALNGFDKTPPIAAPTTRTAPSAVIRPPGYSFPGLQPTEVVYPAQAPIKPQAAPMSPLQMLFGGAPKPAPPPPKPVNPLQYIMQQFLGGGTSGSGTPGDNAQKLNSAQEYCQTANDQASRAYNASQRASSGDTSSRKEAASEAYYAAQSARYAANNATSAAAGGSSEANDAAAQARDAADRAQASADQASSNANGGGW